METPSPPPGPPARESRVRRGWRLTAAAWRLIRSDTTMLLLALVGIGCSFAATLLVFGLGGYLSPDERHGSVALLSTIALYPSIFVGVFFNVALAAAASAALDGEHLGFGEALRIARHKSGAIALWSLLAAVVGVLLNEIARRVPAGGRIAGALLGLAWGLATIFVVPILAIEGGGSLAAVRRSAALVKGRWGEGLTGQFAIGAWTAIAAVPLVLVFAIGAAIRESSPAAGVLLVFAALAGFVLVVGYATAARNVFTVALYRYAIDAPAGGFPAWELEHPFQPAKEKRRSKVLRIGGVVLALLLALMALGAILNHRDRRTAADGYFHYGYPARYAPSFQAGMPVVYERRQIGAVVGVEVEGSTASVTIQVLQGYQAVVASHRAYVTRANGRAYMRIGPLPHSNRGGPDAA